MLNVIRLRHRREVDNFYGKNPPQAFSLKSGRQARPSSTHNVWPQSASRKVVGSPSQWQTKFHSS